jgi:hypothetical protein
VTALTVEEVGKGLPGSDFVDLAVALGDGHPGVEWLLAGQRRRLRTVAPPGGDAARLLARRDGRPVARVTAHQQEDGQGSFGFLTVAGPADADAVRSLLAAAAQWLGDRGAETMIGPLSWTAADEAGVLVAGSDEPAATGRPWNPPWYGDLLETSGLEPVEDRSSYWLAAEDDDAAPQLTPASFVVPADVGRWADPALLLAWPEGRGSIVAVPDIAGGLAGARPGAWSAARRARRRDWAACVVTSVDGPESVLVPGLCAAAARAGYRRVLASWAPDDRPPVMRHRLYQASVASLRGR